MKLIWRVGEEPTGRFRSFDRRAWPTAYYGSAEGKPAAFIYSDTSYSGSVVKSGRHEPLKVRVLHHNHPDNPESWKVVVLKAEFATLKDAKEAVAKFLESHLDWVPASA